MVEIRFINVILNILNIYLIARRIRKERRDLSNLKIIYLLISALRANIFVIKSTNTSLLNLKK